MSNYKPLIYLASPYSHPDIEVRNERVRQTIAAVANLMTSNLVVYSPIVHNHQIAIKHNLPTEWSYWQQFDEVILSKCDQVYVLMLDGWLESRGIKAEITIARKLRLPIGYLGYSEIDYLVAGRTDKVSVIHTSMDSYVDSLRQRYDWI